MAFSQDRDLLVFEPRLFAELAWPGQVIASGGDGSLAGSTFTSASADFVSAGVAAGMVLVVRTSPQPAAVEIVSVDSPLAMTVSALRADPAGDAIPPTISGDDLAWHIVTFDAQAEAVALELFAHFGLSPADPASPWSADDITQPEALRTLSACGVLAVVLAGAANRGDASDGLWAKSLHYRSAFERMLPRVRLGLDNAADGAADVIRHVGAARLRRD
jgi:hypothetical protein